MLAHLSAAARVSTCMATYNGSAYLAEQLESILRELGADDELVIVDDASTDETVAIIESFDDHRIRLHRSSVNRGYVATFGDALARATGDVIFLSDQDDVWIPGRRASLLAATHDGAVVASNLVLLGSDQALPSPLTGRPWLLTSAQNGHPLRNELRMLVGNQPYFGCAMALRAEIRDVILPFPEYLTESHDLWVATVGLAAGEMRHAAAPTIRRRLHDSNASPARVRGVLPALRSRLLLVRLWFEARRRLRRRRAA